MGSHDEQRSALPPELIPAERHFYLELRRLVAAAGLSLRALEESTSAPRSATEPSAFYSKSQWGRWLKGASRPPRKAIWRLSERLAVEEIPAEHLPRPVGQGIRARERYRRYYGQAASAADARRRLRGPDVRAGCADCPGGPGRQQRGPGRDRDRGHRGRRQDQPSHTHRPSGLRPVPGWPAPCEHARVHPVRPGDHSRRRPTGVP